MSIYTAAKKAQAKLKAQAAFLAQHRRATAAIQELQALLIDSLMTAPINGGSETIDYGHVGDISHIASTLELINDRLAQRGEYAPSNQA